MKWTFLIERLVALKGIFRTLEREGSFVGQELEFNIKTFDIREIASRFVSCIFVWPRWVMSRFSFSPPCDDFFLLTGRWNVHMKIILSPYATYYVGGWQCKCSSVLLDVWLCSFGPYFELPYQFMFSIFSVHRISPFSFGLLMIHVDVAYGLFQNPWKHQNTWIFHARTPLHTQRSLIILSRTQSSWRSLGMLDACAWCLHYSNCVTHFLFLEHLWDVRWSVIINFSKLAVFCRCLWWKLVLMLGFGYNDGCWCWWFLSKLVYSRWFSVHDGTVAGIMLPMLEL